jgi:hypothetical protein
MRHGLCDPIQKLLDEVYLLTHIPAPPAALNLQQKMI